MATEDAIQLIVPFSQHCVCKTNSHSYVVIIWRNKERDGEV